MVTLNDFEISSFGRPETSGVYAIWVANFSSRFSKHLLYIGSSNNLHRRVDNSMDHHYRKLVTRMKDYIVFVSYYETLDHIKLEKSLIKLHKPILNKRGK